MKHLQKINGNGEYTTFPGVTVIAPINREQLELWRQVYTCLAECDLATRYYSPLPADSYHMTAVNLYTEAQQASEQIMSWETYLTKKLPFLSQLNAYCNEHAFIPEIGIMDVEVSGSIRLILGLSQYQQKLINTLAKRFHIENRMPDVFHMTLGYQYNYTDEALKKNIQAQLRTTLVHVFNSKTDQLTLQTPTLCYFNTMEHFEPWDGHDYPFTNHEPVIPVGRFF